MIIDKSNIYKYTLFNRIKFYFLYIFYKLILPFEVKHERLKMFLLECEYSLNNFFAHFFKFKKTCIIKRDLKHIETIFGKFYLRNNTLDALVASPAFERLDVNYLLKHLEKLSKNKTRILFIDVGADFGYYSIVVLNHMHSKLINVLAIEPIKSSYLLMKKNISANRVLKRFKSKNIGAFNKPIRNLKIGLDIDQPGSNSLVIGGNKFERINVSTLDKILTKSQIKSYDAFIIKIDTEGCESEIMEGAKNLIATKKRILIMVEDFMNPKIIETMQKLQFKFLCKISDYNSWWQIN